MVPDRALAERATGSSSPLSGQEPRSRSARAEAILALQRTAGNRAVGQLLQHAPVRGVEEAVSAPAQASLSASGALTLQHTAGNRAVGRLMRRTKGPAKRKGPPLATLTVKPPQEMTGDEFALFALMQLYRVERDEARVILQEMAESGIQRRGHFVTGIGHGDVGQEIKVVVSLRVLNAGQSEDVAERAAEMAALPEAERKALNAEADRRYFERVRGKRRKLGLGADEEGNRAVWMQTRDEILVERERILDLPERTRQFLKSERANPADYKAMLRIADRVKDFTDQDWALYRRRSAGATTDLALVEESVNRFVEKRQRDRSIQQRVMGTEKAYDLVKVARMYTAMDNGENTERVLEAWRAAYEALPAEFHTADEYAAACADYLALIEKRALELTLFTLHTTANVVTEALTRYRDTSELTALFTRQSKMRHLVQESVAAGSRETHSQQEQEQALWESSNKWAAAEEERKSQVGADPILADPELTAGSLNVASPAALGKVLVKNAEDRMVDIRKTFTRVLRDHDAIYQFDRIIAMTLEELGEGAGSIGTKLVEDRKSSIAMDRIFRALAMAALAIGLTVVTAGGGTIGLVFGSAQATLGITQAVDEYERYAEAMAATRTAFDRDKAVSGNEPSKVWVALALIGAGIDTASLASAIRAVAPAVKVLEDTGDLVKFEAMLAKATKLNASARQRMLNAGRAQQEYEDAVADLATTWRGAGAPFVLMGARGAALLLKVTKVAYHYARRGLRDFEAFLAELRVQKFMQGIDLDNLTPQQLGQLRTAFDNGVAEWSGTSSLRFELRGREVTLTYAEDGSLLLDGKAMSLAQRDNVFKRLGLSHTDAGHGPLRPSATIAGEAVQNARRGEGMAGQFASDEAMLQSAARAKLRRGAGEGRMAQPDQPTSSGWVVEFEAPPGTGRVYAENGSIPAGATITNRTPFPNLPVAELPVTHVRAVFDGHELTNLFPIHIPPVAPPPLPPPPPPAVP
jgi:hypothetical protein